jgi:hypothetical protein
MAHEDAGHYAAKHPPGTELNARIAGQIKAHMVDGRISCAAAHKIAEELQVSAREVGVTIDLLEIRINLCQLGLFGHSREGKVVVPAKEIPPEVQQALEEALDEKGLSCFAAWKLAEQLTMTRPELSSVCEALGIKISRCQLGTF